MSGNRLLRSTAVFSAMTFLSRIAGYLRDWLLEQGVASLSVTAARDEQTAALVGTLTRDGRD